MRLLRGLLSGLMMLAFSVTMLAFSLTARAGQPVQPIEIKVVVISMFEVGEDTGDAPGEFQYWVEREHLDTVMAFPQGYHDLRMNAKTGVLGMVAGVGSARTAASVMALGLDPRFDLTHAFFLIAGIAGIDPAVGSLGSVVWSDFVVDGDLAHEIDAREIPQATEAERRVWTTGYVPLGKSMPYEAPRSARFGDDGNVFALNAGLVTWAYELTKAVELPDTEQMRERRMRYLPGVADAPAHRPPFVLRGDDLSAGTFWHGKLMNAWAQRWVKYQTDGRGRYAVCGMEDTGTMQALVWLARAGRVDGQRVLVLRAASNFDQQREGITAAESLAETKVRQYSAYLPSLEDAYRVGHVVVDSLVSNWARDRERLPTAALR